ncbi:hypothetical protein [Actinomadura fibrosa]|uniref:Transcriptional regulator n=1 Tax=Actinomadura fibrosa TaxID=111802 RepID=A0ABW2XBD5_9ACTN|nr:hypothetical protein [Actinomadura fibrosa]
MTAASPLGELLAVFGLRADQLARRLNDMSEALGRPERVHTKTPYKWLRGEVPRSPWRSLTALLLEQELGRPISVADLGWPPDDLECAPATTGLQTAWTTAGTLRAIRAVADAGYMDRRSFLLMLGASLTSPAHEWLVAHPTTSLAQAVGTAVPAQIVDDLDAITARLRHMDDQLGGGPLLRLIHEHLRYVTTLLTQGRYDDTTGKRLHATAAELLRLAGFTAFDSGQHGLAQRYWVAGLHAAHTAGDRALGANIIGFMSCQAKDLDGGREAVLLAQTARTGYPGGSGRVTAILELRAAEAHANDQTATTTRRATDIRRAIDTAFDALQDPRPSSDDPGWSYWMTDTHAHGQAGYCYLRSGDHQRARHHLRQAVKTDTDSREGALRQILLATTYIQQPQPELEPALSYAHRALGTLSGQVDSARCRSHLSRFSEHLAPYRRNTNVRTFLDQVKAAKEPSTRQHT